MARDRDPVRRQATIAQKAFEDTHATADRRQASLRRLAGAPARGAAAVTGGRGRRRYSARHMLTAELLAGAGLVALRAVADYEPQADGTLKGKIAHPKGQYGPLPVLAGLVTIFFLLSFAAARGGTRAKVAVIAGGLVDLVLAMKSLDEFNTVAHTFARFGTVRRPPGDWQTAGTAAGTPVAGSLATPPAAGGNGGQGSGRGRKTGPSPCTTADGQPGFWYAGSCHPFEI